MFHKFDNIGLFSSDGHHYCGLFGGVLVALHKIRCILGNEVKRFLSVIDQ